MASDLVIKCRAAGESVQKDLDEKESPADGVMRFEIEAYPELQDVRQEFEKVNGVGTQGGSIARANGWLRIIRHTLILSGRVKACIG